MTKRIIFPLNDGICILTPSDELPLVEVAKKDVPANVPYIIVESNTIPSDRSFRDAWEADFSQPDGYGIGADAWFAEQAAKETE